MRSLIRVLVPFAFALLPSTAMALPLDSLLAHAMEGRFVPAMSVLVIRDVRIAEQAVRGRRASDAPDSVTLDDVWHLGSCGKAMTATLVARLVERRVLAWETPLPKLLPELAATMRPEYRTVTLVQLLSHTSGLPENVAFDSIMAMYDDRRPLPAQRLAFARLALNDPPIAPPGTKTSYSNSAFMIVAAAIEHATHKSFEDLMRKEVFQPLGMTTAGFGPTHRGQPLGHRTARRSKDRRPTTRWRGRRSAASSCRCRTGRGSRSTTCSASRAVASCCSARPTPISTHR